MGWSVQKRESVGVLALRGMGADGHGEVGPMTMLGYGESGIEEGDRLRTDLTGGRGAGPERGLELGVRSLPKRLRNPGGEKNRFRTGD